MDIDAVIRIVLHVCSTIGNLQEADKFDELQKLLADLDGLNEQFNKLKNTFQSDAPREQRVETYSHDRQSNSFNVQLPNKLEQTIQIANNIKSFFQLSVNSQNNSWSSMFGSSDKKDKHQEYLAELAKQEANRQMELEKKKKDAIERRKREEEQAEREFQETLKKMEKSRKEKEKQFQEQLLFQKKRDEEEAMRRSANDREMEQKLENIRNEKKEGALKIETVEKEKEKIIENRLIELDKYTEEMKEIARVHREQLQQIQERNRTLKIENAKQRREQLEIENSKIVQKLDGDIQKLLEHISHQNARDVVKRFQHIVEPVYNVRSSLENIRAYCILPNEEIPQVPMGELDPDFNLIHEQTKLFEYRVRCFQQFIINTTNTDPALFKVCSEFIKQMDTLMSKTELRSVCTHLPRALGDRNNKNIKLYGNYLDGLCSNFDDMKTSLSDGVQDITQKHVHGSSSNQRFIEE